MSDKSSENCRFTPQQLRAIELLAQDEITKAEVAKEVKISARQLYTWRQNPEFIRAVGLYAIKLLGNDVPGALRALGKRAKNQGDPQAVKAVMEFVGLYEETTNVNVNTRDVFAEIEEYANTFDKCNQEGDAGGGGVGEPVHPAQADG